MAEASKGPQITEASERPKVSEASERPRMSASVRRNKSFAQGDLLRYRRSFDLFDLEKNGRVFADKLGDIVKRLGYKLTEEQIKTILEENELGETDTVSFEKFLELIPKNDKAISEEQHRLADLRDKFRRYDVDKNGVISLQEAQWALQVELKVSPQTALRLLNQFVKLDYHHFVEFYQQVQDKKLEMYEKFGKYDADRDGMISAEEAHSVLHKELGYTEARSKAMVDRFDQNHDGLVSYMEFAEFFIAVEEKKKRVRQAFLHFDKDGLGYVTYDQAIEILQNLLSLREERCRQITENYDKNKDGRIDYEEFLEFYAMLEEERQRILDQFKAYDKDNDGLISFDEFKSMLTAKGYTEADVNSLMTGCDVNKDGYLNIDEFKTFLSFGI